ncbi:uncharacterized protein [Centruroides vittatus]|uniref:uncharacterized protein isoform X1 n=1 Tax=Centruroides vittatus TaxID=120091 RepID=UPI0035100FEB
MHQTNQESVSIRNTEHSTKKKPFDILTNIFRKKSKDQESDSELPDDTSKARNNVKNLVDSENINTIQIKRTQPIPTPTNIYIETRDRSSSVHGLTVYSNRSPVSPRVRSLEEDMEALRLSRQDNPYIQQKLESYSLYGDSRGSISPSSVYSSLQKHDEEKLVSEEFEDLIIKEENEQNLHEHLIRSPPPKFPKKMSQFVFHSRTGSPQHQVRDSYESIQDNVSQVSNLTNSNTLLKTKGSLSMTSVNDNGQIKDLKKNKDLKPLTKKQGTGALDPSMRQVLEFQKQIYFPDSRVEINSPVDNTNKRSSDLSPHRSHSLISKSWSTNTVSRSVSLPTTTITYSGGSNEEEKSYSLAPVKGAKLNYYGTGQSAFGIPHSLNNDVTTPKLHRNRLSSHEDSSSSSSSNQEFG